MHGFRAGPGCRGARGLLSGEAVGLWREGLLSSLEGAAEAGIGLPLRIVGASSKCIALSLFKMAWGSVRDGLQQY